MIYNIVNQMREEQRQARDNLFLVASGKLKRREEHNRIRSMLGLPLKGD